MFKRDKNMIGQKVRRLRNQYGDAFKGMKPEPLFDPPIEGKLSRDEVVNMVEVYVDQGMSKRQAFKRIADRYAEYVCRPVNLRGIESRYYKAMAAA